MCHCATQLFFTYFLMNHSFYYIRTSHKHVTFFFHHKDEIGQGRRVAGTSGARTQDCRNLWNHTAGHCILIENISITGKALDPFLDTCTARIIQSDNRGTVLQCKLLYFHNLFSIGSWQWAAIYRKVISVNKHLATVYLSITGHDTISRNFVLIHTVVRTTVNHQLIQFNESTLIE